VFEYSIRDFFEAQTEVGVECVVASSCWLFEGLGFVGAFSCEVLEMVLVDGGTSMRLFEDDFVLSLSVYMNAMSAQSASG